MRAIAPSTLLVLDAERFRRLVVRSPAVQKAIRASAVQRGIDPDALMAEALSLPKPEEAAK